MMILRTSTINVLLILGLKDKNPPPAPPTVKPSTVLLTPDERPPPPPPARVPESKSPAPPAPISSQLRAAPEPVALPLALAPPTPPLSTNRPGARTMGFGDPMPPPSSLSGYGSPLQRRGSSDTPQPPQIISPSPPKTEPLPKLPLTTASSQALLDKEKESAGRDATTNGIAQRKRVDSAPTTPFGLTGSVDRDRPAVQRQNALSQGSAALLPTPSTALGSASTAQSPTIVPEQVTDRREPLTPGQMNGRQGTGTPSDAPRQLSEVQSLANRQGSDGLIETVTPLAPLKDAVAPTVALTLQKGEAPAVVDDDGSNGAGASTVIPRVPLGTLNQVSTISSTASETSDVGTQPVRIPGIRGTSKFTSAVPSLQGGIGALPKTTGLEGHEDIHSSRSEPEDDDLNASQAEPHAITPIPIDLYKVAQQNSGRSRSAHRSGLTTARHIDVEDDAVSPSRPADQTVVLQSPKPVVEEAPVSDRSDGEDGHTPEQIRGGGTERTSISPVSLGAMPSDEEDSSAAKRSAAGSVRLQPVVINGKGTLGSQFNSSHSPASTQAGDVDTRSDTTRTSDGSKKGDATGTVTKPQSLLSGISQIPADLIKDVQPQPSVVPGRLKSRHLSSLAKPVRLEPGKPRQVASQDTPLKYVHAAQGSPRPAIGPLSPLPSDMLDTVGAKRKPSETDGDVDRHEPTPVPATLGGDDDRTRTSMVPLTSGATLGHDPITERGKGSNGAQLDSGFGKDVTAKRPAVPGPLNDTGSIVQGLGAKDVAKAKQNPATELSTLIPPVELGLAGLATGGKPSTPSVVSVPVRNARFTSTGVKRFGDGGGPRTMRRATSQGASLNGRRVAQVRDPFRAPITPLPPSVDRRLKSPVITKGVSAAPLQPGRSIDTVAPLLESTVPQIDEVDRRRAVQANAVPGPVNGIVPEAQAKSPSVPVVRDEVSSQGVNTILPALGTAGHTRSVTPDKSEFERRQRVEASTTPGLVQPLGNASPTVTSHVSDQQGSDDDGPLESRHVSTVAPVLESSVRTRSTTPDAGETAIDDLAKSGLQRSPSVATRFSGVQSGASNRITSGGQPRLVRDALQMATESLHSQAHPSVAPSLISQRERRSTAGRSTLTSGGEGPRTVQNASPLVPLESHAATEVVLTPRSEILQEETVTDGTPSGDGTQQRNAYRKRTSVRKIRPSSNARLQATTDIDILKTASIYYVSELSESDSAADEPLGPRRPLARILSRNDRKPSSSSDSDNTGSSSVSRFVPSQHEESSSATSQPTSPEGAEGVTPSTLSSAKLTQIGSAGTIRSTHGSESRTSANLDPSAVIEELRRRREQVVVPPSDAGDRLRSASRRSDARTGSNVSSLDEQPEEEKKPVIRSTAITNIRPGFEINEALREEIGEILMAPTRHEIRDEPALTSDSKHQSQTAQAAYIPRSRRSRKLESPLNRRLNPVDEVPKTRSFTPPPQRPDPKHTRRRRRTPRILRQVKDETPVSDHVSRIASTDGQIPASLPTVMTQDQVVPIPRSDHSSDPQHSTSPEDTDGGVSADKPLPRKSSSSARSESSSAPEASVPQIHETSSPEVTIPRIRNTSLGRMELSQWGLSQLGGYEISPSLVRGKRSSTRSVAFDDEPQTPPSEAPEPVKPKGRIIVKRQRRRRPPEKRRANPAALFETEVLKPRDQPVQRVEDVVRNESPVRVRRRRFAPTG